MATDVAQCKNGNPMQNCNMYSDEQYVYLDGGLEGPGTYVFGVVQPNGRDDPTGMIKADGGYVLSLDEVSDRVFTVQSDGTVVSNSGLHVPVQDPGDGMKWKVPVFYFDQTGNPGGVYKLVVCKINLPTDPSVNLDDFYAQLNESNFASCKSDNFKVVQMGVNQTNAEPLSVDNQATVSYDSTWQWSIDKTADVARAFLLPGQTKTVDYTVAVTNTDVVTSNYVVSGVATVHNPNNANFVVTVTDSDSTCQFQSVNGSAVLAPSSAITTSVAPGDTTFEYTCTAVDTLTATDNTVTLSWADQTSQDLTDRTLGLWLEDSSQFVVDPGVATLGTFTENRVGTHVTVTDKLDGQSDQTLGFITVNDDGTLSAEAVDPNPLGVVVAVTGDTVTFTYARDLDGVEGTVVTHLNTATFTTDSGDTGNDHWRVRIWEPTTATPPTIDSNKATAIDSIAWTWTVKKTVTGPSGSGSKITVNIVPGKTTHVNYTVTVAPSTRTEAFAVSGVVTASNDNAAPFDVTLTNAGLSDGTRCVFTSSNATTVTATLAAHSTQTFAYTCATTSNKAAVTAGAKVSMSWATQGDHWPSRVYLPAGSAGLVAGPVADADIAQTITGASVTVTDKSDATGTVPLGSVTINNPAGTLAGATVSATAVAPATVTTAGAQATFAYGADLGKGTWNNVATACWSADPKDCASGSATVTVTTPKITGGLTIGYWQNPNGQALILHSAVKGSNPATVGCYGLSSWLVTTVPNFNGDKETLTANGNGNGNNGNGNGNGNTKNQTTTPTTVTLSASSTCTEVANWATGVFNAATGSDMPTMLKAQIMATAFSVYFSNGQSLGAVTIDLSAISSATASSFGTNAMTINDLLTFVGSQPWSSDAKAKAQLTIWKDVFDAINNNNVYGM